MQAVVDGLSNSEFSVRDLHVDYLKCSKPQKPYFEGGKREVQLNRAIPEQKASSSLLKAKQSFGWGI